MKGKDMKNTTTKAKKGYWCPECETVNASRGWMYDRFAMTYRCPQCQCEISKSDRKVRNLK